MILGKKLHSKIQQNRTAFLPFFHSSDPPSYPSIPSQSLGNRASASPPVAAVAVIQKIPLNRPISEPPCRIGVAAVSATGPKAFDLVYAISTRIQFGSYFTRTCKSHQSADEVPCIGHLRDVERGMGLVPEGSEHGRRIEFVHRRPFLFGVVFLQAVN